jgi:hypothetical protein
MRYIVDENKRPINRIYISGTQILEVDLNKGWEITDIEFKDDIPANEIDYLVVRFEKKMRAGEKE